MGCCHSKPRLTKEGGTCRNPNAASTPPAGCDFRAMTAADATPRSAPLTFAERPSSRLTPRLPTPITDPRAWTYLREPEALPKDDRRAAFCRGRATMPSMFVYERTPEQKVPMRNGTVRRIFTGSDDLRGMRYSEDEVADAMGPIPPNRNGVYRNGAFMHRALERRPTQSR